jgi:hypothetical protein
MTILGLALLILWVSYYFCYVPSIVSSTRFKLFRVRDNLMDRAISREIEYESEVHQTLRNSIHELIRITHKLSWLRAILLYKAIKKHDEKSFAAWRQKNKEKLNSLPESQREIYKSAMDEVDCILINHLNNRSAMSLILSQSMRALSKSSKSFGLFRKEIKNLRRLQRDAVDKIEASTLPGLMAA